MINLTQSLEMPGGRKFAFFGMTYFGVCNTYGSNQDKYVSIDGFNEDCFVTGTKITVLFNYRNTAANPNLVIDIVDSTGSLSSSVSYPIRGVDSSSIGSYAWNNNEYIDFIYSNGSWVLFNRQNIPYLYGVCDTYSSDSTKHVTIKGINGSYISPGTIIFVNFTENNTDTIPYLSINGGIPSVPIFKTSTTTGQFIGPFEKGVMCLIYAQISSTNSNFAWFAVGQPLVPNITVPTKVSDLTNDSGFVTPAGARNAAPVQSVNGLTGAVTVTVPSNVSSFINDAGYLTLASLPIWDGSVV